MNELRKSVQLLKDLNTYDVYFSLDNGCICLEVTDGDHDRNWRVDFGDSQKLLSALELIDKTGEQWQNAVKKLFQPAEADRCFYIQKFEQLCEHYGVKYNYTSWLGSGIGF